jgi:lipoyl(octanoyl) transferase
MTPCVELLDWGMVDYAGALSRQRALFDELIARKSAANRPGTAEFAMASEAGCDDVSAGWLILCEHPHVYTLGRSGKSENLLVSGELLRERGATLHRVDRGGDITYHGPGQIVGYPILDLDRAGLGLRAYIAALEQAVIETVALFGIAAGRVEGKTGVWVGDRGDFETAEAESPLSRKPERKICAIGVRASRGVVMHGFALNVATDPGWFEMINPCGFAGGAVTSMSAETGQKIASEEVKRVLCGRLGANMGLKII